MPYWLIRPIAWVLIRLIYIWCGGVRFEGRENVPLTGGVLIAPNHISDADPPTVGVALPRPCYFMAKEELFDMKGVGPIIRWLHGFPVKRYTADRAALRLSEELMAKGEVVVIFPEGKLSEDGKLQELLPGALMAAQRANVPVVPTIIVGTDLVMPYGKLTPRRSGRRTIVRFGPQVTVAQLTGGKRGGEGLKIGAARLRMLMLALQEGKPYPPLDAPLPVLPSETAEEEPVTEPALPG